MLCAMRVRDTVVTLSIMSWDNERRPLAGDGSTVSRKIGASTSVLVSGTTVTLACVLLNKSDCITSAGRGLPNHRLVPRRQHPHASTGPPLGVSGFVEPSQNLLLGSPTLRRHPALSPTFFSETWSLCVGNPELNEAQTCTLHLLTVALHTSSSRTFFCMTCNIACHERIR